MAFDRLTRRGMRVLSRHNGWPLRIGLALIALLLAGCAASTQHELDTGTIAPRESKTLTFAERGVVSMLCHPHPFMLHEVTVVQGGEVRAHVHIFDGPDTDDYRFEPRNLTVGPGAKVEYHNHGTLAHTATAAGAHGGH